MKNILKWIIIKLFNTGTAREFILKIAMDCYLNEPKIVGPRERLILHSKAQLNNYLVNTNSGIVTIEDYVFFGKNVSIITGTHDYNKTDKERMECYPRQGRNITIHKGAWIASNSTIIGPCTIGEGSVVAAGSVVINDVRSFTIVGGNPAKLIKDIKLSISS